MTAFRNGILRKESEPRYSDLQLRISAILNEYENACTWAAVLEGRYRAAGDTECADIAAQWYAAVRPLKIRAQRLYKAVNQHQTAVNCMRHREKMENAWEAKRS
jgi:hypothetical protein